MSSYMSDEMYLAALLRLQSFTDPGRGYPLRCEDSNTPGDKYNWCTWGLCSDKWEMWPEPEMHIWPDQFKERGRIAPLYRESHQLCPCDIRDVSTGNGCFWTCIVFRYKARMDIGLPKNASCVNANNTQFYNEYRTRLAARIACIQQRIKENGNEQR